MPVFLSKMKIFKMLLEDDVQCQCDVDQKQHT
jgi:hypothetical protein